jgi:hypothetical protein
MTKTRYDVLQAQLEYIKNGGAWKKFNSETDGNDGLINRTTTDLYDVCVRVDDAMECPEGSHRNGDGICVPNE